MPGTVKVKVVSARDLPIMDRSSELTDAFVELRLGENYQRTRVCPKTLNPVWDSQWFTFSVSDEDLQDEPLQIKLMDRDIYTAHDAIGKVYIRLNSLTGSGRQAVNTKDGWFPIYDTLHGIRGQVHLVVKVEMIRDQHRFKQSSCGVMFFACPQVPSCYSVQSIHGFVEELVVNDDPEYQWIDKIRTPRASNEARQRLFSKLSGELQRKIGLKALEVGGNAVIGYRQYFDLEGESGIVVRGIGTCVKLIHKLPSASGCPTPLAALQLPAIMQQAYVERDELYVDPVSGLVSPQHHGEPRKVSMSDSDGPPSPNKITAGLIPIGEVPPSTSTGSSGLHSAAPHTYPEVIPSSEFPFYTLSLLPPGTLSHIGGLVSAHSVKLLDKINNPDEPETRDAWWQEVRNEVRLHARAMNCNTVIGYSETTSICDNLCVFSAFGTAVCISTTQQLSKRIPTSPGTGNESHGSGHHEGEVSKDTEVASHDIHWGKASSCGPCHIPYSVGSLPFEGKLSKCCVCRSKLVPALLLSTCEVPDGLLVRGRGALIQATAVLSKKKLKGDENAQQVGQKLPFLESILHERLLNKLRVKGMNALFQYRMLLNIGDAMVVGTAVGTAVYLEALPGPPKLLLSSQGSTLEPTKLEEYQTALTQAQVDNRRLFDLDQPRDFLPTVRADSANGSFDGVGGEEGLKPMELASGNKEALVFPLSEQYVKPESLSDVISDKTFSTGFYFSNTHVVPGLSMGLALGDTKMVTMVTKIVLDTHRQAPHLELQFSKFFRHLLQSLAFKVRHMSPCALTNITYDIDLPEDNELQVAVTAMVTSLKSQDQKKTQSDELIFTMEDNHPGVTSQQEALSTEDQRSPANVVHTSSLPFIPGYHVERYLGIINLFLIRESTSVGEVSRANSFMHLFILEALSIARAHVAALGGNALLSYRLSELVFIEHPQKNQAQCLLNLSGDAALLSHQSGHSNRASPQHHTLQAMQLIQMSQMNLELGQPSLTSSSADQTEPQTSVVVSTA